MNSLCKTHAYKKEENNALFCSWKYKKADLLISNSYWKIYLTERNTFLINNIYTIQAAIRKERSYPKYCLPLHTYFSSVMNRLMIKITWNYARAESSSVGENPIPSCQPIYNPNLLWEWEKVEWEGGRLSHWSARVASYASLNPFRPI